MTSKPPLFCCVIRIGLALLAAAASSRAQGLFRGPCDTKDYPVLVYDAARRQTHIVPRNLASNLALGLTIAGEPLEFTRFLCDNAPVEMYVVNRKLKESFNVTITGTFAVPLAVVSVRGVTPLGTPPPTTTTTPPPTPTPKGATGASVPTVTIVVNQLLSQETFNQPEQALRQEAEQLRGQARADIVSIEEYSGKLNRLINIPLTPGAPPSGNAEGSATLVALTSAFSSLIFEIPSELPDQAPGHILPDIEVRFDRLIGRMGILIQNVQRLNASMQSFPISDQFTALETAAENFEASLQSYRQDIQNIQLAVQVIQNLANNSRQYLIERNAAAVRQDLQTAFPNVPNMDANSIAGIVTQKYNDAGRFITALTAPLGLLDQLSGRLADYAANKVPDAALLDPGAMRARVQTVRSVFPDLRNAIDLLNQTEASAFDAINERYRNVRILAPQAAYLNLPAYAGTNMSVFYTVTGAESFQPYQMLNNEIPQPSPAVLQAAQGAAPTAPVAIAAATPAAPTAAPAVSTTASAPSTTPPPEYSGNFQIHHFDHGTIFAGFGISRVPSASYSVATTNCNPATGTKPQTAAIPPCMPNTPFYALSRSTSNWNAAAIVGVELYFHAQDMYPRTSRGFGLFRSPGLLIGTSVYPLNQYYVGPSFEPVHGFTFGAGFSLGTDSKLTSANFVNQNLGTVTSGSTAPNLSSTSGYHGGVFLTVGFDLNIFEAVFGGLKQVGTPSGSTGTSGNQ